MCFSIYLITKLSLHPHIDFLCLYLSFVHFSFDLPMLKLLSLTYWPIIRNPALYPQGQYTHETLIFKDDGAEAVTCPADDPVNVSVFQFIHLSVRLCISYCYIKIT